MISVEEASRRVLENTPPPRVEKLPIEEASGRTLAEDIISPEPSPRYTSSAMDGFTLKWKDIADSSHERPARLPIAGESRAGAPFHSELQDGTAVRISTGAMMPTGADTVVPVEGTKEEAGWVIILEREGRGRHVRKAGEEIGIGEAVMETGRTLDPASIALLYSLGIEEVKVYARPRVAVVVTGSEFPDRGEKPRPWQIRDSNSLMLSSAVRSSGAEETHATRIEDDLHETIAALNQALSGADIVVASGGVSVGAHDLLRPAAERLEFETLFWKVDQKPGKPLFFARKGTKLLFGLPGNPVSALNCYAYYVHPLLQAMRGRTFRWTRIEGVLVGEALNRGQRTLFLRCRLEEDRDPPIIRPLAKQGSHMLTSIAHADGFLLLPARRELCAGDRAELFLYPWVAAGGIGL